MTLAVKKVTKKKQVREGDLVLIVHEGRSDEDEPGFTFGPVSYISDYSEFFEAGAGFVDLDDEHSHVFRFRNKED